MPLIISDVRSSYFIDLYIHPDLVRVDHKSIVRSQFRCYLFLADYGEKKCNGAAASQILGDNILKLNNEPGLETIFNSISYRAQSIVDLDERIFIQKLKSNDDDYNDDNSNKYNNTKNKTKTIHVQR